MTQFAKLSWTDFEVISKAGATGSMTRNSCRRRMKREQPPKNTERL